MSVRTKVTWPITPPVTVSPPTMSKATMSVFFEWEVSGFKDLTEPIYSRTFSTLEATWCLYLKPFSQDSGEHVSLYLTMCSPKPTGQIPVRFELETWADGNLLLRGSCVGIFSRNELCWGCRSSILRKDLLKSAKISPIICSVKIFDKDRNDQFCRGAVLDDIAALFNDPSTADVQFQVQGRPLYAHKLILSARSPYFRAMFCRGFKESLQSNGTPQVVEMPEDQYDHFMLLLYHLYTGKAVIDNADIDISPRDLLELASKYQATDLELYGQEQAISEMTLDNMVSDFFDWGHKYPHVRRAHIKAISMHYPKIRETKEYKANFSKFVREERDATVLQELIDGLTKM